MKSRYLKLSVAFLMIIAPLALANEDVWTPDKMMKERNVGATALSPDGKWVAYTVTEAVMTEDKSEYLTHIWISATDGSRTFKLTSGEKSCNSPAWSADGKWIAFTSSRSGKNNIWLIRTDGGEAEMLTDVESGAGNIQWSPDGSEIAFLMNDPETDAEKKAKKAKDDAHVVDADFKYTHLYRIKAGVTGDERPEPARVTEGEMDVSGYDWSPDGKSFVIVHTKSPLIDDWRTADISIVPAEGGDLVPLVRSLGFDSQAQFSPDGKTVAFVSDRGDLVWARHWKICLIPAAGGDVTVLPETYDGRPGLAEWAPDGSGVYYNESFHTNSFLFFAPVDGGAHRRVGDMMGVCGAFDVSDDGSLLSFTRENLNEPEEVFILSLESGGEPVKLTSANAGLPDLPFAKTEVVSWRSFDGREIEGILHYPLGYEEGKKYPAILNVHGGPAGVFAQTFTAGASIYPLEAFAAKGFFVLRPNPRGSSGYGAEFRYANISDWGVGDYKDLMAGVDYLVDRGLADPDRLGVMGWSYGGYMTSWVITQTDRFKAAAVGAGVTNLVSFTGTTDITGFIPSYFEGEMWERDEVYRAHSAMFHIGNAVTPTLILHGQNDARVPIGQGFELYTALKHKGVEVQMVTYPRTPHGPREPKLLLDVMNRHLEWFSQRLLEAE